jgi:two-component system response regulator (stage 0 sporulation protein A)
MERKIFNCLNELGIPCNVLGRGYLETAIMMALERGKISITKGLYSGVSEKHNTTPARVERAIRHSITLFMENADTETIKKYFGNAVSASARSPQNSAFIYGVAKYIKVFEPEEI